MKLETRTAMPQQQIQSDYREVLTAVFGLMNPDTGQIEWLLDRIEGTSEARAWA